MHKVSFVVYALDEKFQFLDMIVHDECLEKLKKKLSNVEWERVKSKNSKKLGESKKIS